MTPPCLLPPLFNFPFPLCFSSPLLLLAPHIVYQYLLCHLPLFSHHYLSLSPLLLHLPPNISHLHPALLLLPLLLIPLL